MGSECINKHLIVFDIDIDFHTKEKNTIGLEGDLLKEHFFHVIELQDKVIDFNLLLSLHFIQMMKKNVSWANLSLGSSLQPDPQNKVTMPF